MKREDLKKLHTINEFAASHSICSGLIENIEEYTCTDDEENNYDTPHQIGAIEWNSHWQPAWATKIDEIDDGDTHDVSRVIEYVVKIDGYGEIRIYSYNNNAWGHCDIIMDSDNIKSIKDWLSVWDELPEEWLKDYVSN